mmetsp:Transcript_30357/g.88235  ORF Transcript_30357/g.88235 Transcript_30357/m.88235 type:complete len:269 (+) Transcript_30357:156-962(+)
MPLLRRARPAQAPLSLGAIPHPLIRLSSCRGFAASSSSDSSDTAARSSVDADEWRQRLRQTVTARQRRRDVASTDALESSRRHLDFVRHFFGESYSWDWPRLELFCSRVREVNAQLKEQGKPSMSPADLRRLETRHLLLSLALTRAMNLQQFVGRKPPVTLLDVGSGCGFPGIPLAIVYPELRVHCIDASLFASQVLNKVIHPLRLANVTVTNVSIEKLDERARFDVIVGRSVCALSHFVALSAPHLAKAKGTLKKAATGGTHTTQRM